MDIIDAYTLIDRAVLAVAKSINILNEVEDEKRTDYVRLEENPFVLTEDIKRVCQVVTAHDLREYRNKFHSIKLEEAATSWLQLLLQIDEKVE